MPAVAPLSSAAAAVVRNENARTTISDVRHDTTLSTHVPASRAVTKPQGDPRHVNTNLDTVPDQQVPTGN